MAFQTIFEVQEEVLYDLVALTKVFQVREPVLLQVLHHLRMSVSIQDEENFLGYSVVTVQVLIFFLKFLGASLTV